MCVRTHIHAHGYLHGHVMHLQMLGRDCECSLDCSPMTCHHGLAVAAGSIEGLRKWSQESRSAHQAASLFGLDPYTVLYIWERSCLPPSDSSGSGADEGVKSESLVMQVLPVGGVLLLLIWV